MVEHAMSDKAERVAMRLWAPTYSPQDYLEKAAAILRKEYPEEGKQVEHDFAIYKDGNQFCAVAHGFRNLQQDDAGFGDTPETALAALLKRPAPDVSALREVSPGVWLTESRHAAECLWRDLPLNEDGTFRSTTSSLDIIEKHMVAFLEGHRPAPDVSEVEKALCMDILGERGRSVDEVNRLSKLLIAYREGLKAQAAPDVSALREAYCISVCGEYCTSMQCRSWRKFVALLRSEPKEESHE